jgi:hypothetical protein
MCRDCEAAIRDASGPYTVLCGGRAQVSRDKAIVFRILRTLVVGIGSFAYTHGVVRLSMLRSFFFTILRSREQ